MKLNAIVFTTAIFLSVSVFASDSKMQIAAVQNDAQTVTKNVDEDLDEEIGSTDTSGFDNRIGAFSREDGAMDGAYGDGEFAD